MHPRDGPTQSEGHRQHRVHAEVLLSLHHVDPLVLAGVGAKLAAPPRGASLEVEQGAVDVEQGEGGDVAPFEGGRDDLQHVVDGAEAALAAVALGPLEQRAQRVVELGADPRLVEALGEGVDARLDAPEESGEPVDDLLPLRVLDRGVHQVDGLPGAGRGAERRRALERESHPDRGEPDLHGGAHRGDARIRGLLVGADLVDDGLLAAGQPVLRPDLVELEQPLRDGLVLDQPLRVGAPPRLQAQGVGGQRDVRLHVVVGALRAMRDDDLETLAERDQHREQGLGERADLVRLDEHAVEQALLGRLLDGPVIRGDQVVPDDEDAVPQPLPQEPPALVVVLGEAVLDGEDGDLLALDGGGVEGQHAVAVEDGSGLVPPEQVASHAVRQIELGAVGLLQLAHGRVERDGHVHARSAAALGDGPLHQGPEAHLGQRVAPLLDVGGEAALEADAHDAASLLALDDLLEPGLQPDRQLLRFLVAGRAQDEEHRLLHADVGFRVFLLGVPASHAAVAELPGGGHRSESLVGGLLHPLAEHPALQARGLLEPARDGSDRLRLLARLALAAAERRVLAPVGEPEVEERDEPDAQEQTPDVDGPRVSADESGRDQHHRGRQQRERGIPARARPRRRHRQVVGRVGIVVEALARDSEGAPDRDRRQQLEVVEPPPRQGAAQALLRVEERPLVERVEAGRGDEVSHLVQRDAEMEAQIGEDGGDQRLRAGEDEPEHAPLEERGRRQGQDRRDERDVEGNQDVVRDHPPFLERGGAARPVPGAAGPIVSIHDASRQKSARCHRDHAPRAPGGSHAASLLPRPGVRRDLCTPETSLLRRHRRRPQAQRCPAGSGGFPSIEPPWFEVHRVEGALVLPRAASLAAGPRGHNRAGAPFSWVIFMGDRATSATQGRGSITLSCARWRGKLSPWTRVSRPWWRPPARAARWRSSTTAAASK